MHKVRHVYLNLTVSRPRLAVSNLKAPAGQQIGRLKEPCPAAASAYSSPTVRSHLGSRVDVKSGIAARLLPPTPSSPRHPLMPNHASLALQPKVATLSSRPSALPGSTWLYPISVASNRASRLLLPFWTSTRISTRISTAQPTNLARVIATLWSSQYPTAPHPRSLLVA